MADSTEPSQQGQTFFTLSNGSYTGSTSILPGGTYNIWGAYGGDYTNGFSASAKTQITVTPEASAIDFNMFSGNSYFTSSSGPGTSVDYGTQLLLSALVAPSSQAAAYQTCLINGTTCPLVRLPKVPAMKPSPRLFTTVKSVPVAGAKLSVKFTVLPVAV